MKISVAIPAFPYIDLDLDEVLHGIRGVSGSVGSWLWVALSLSNRGYHVEICCTGGSIKPSQILSTYHFNTVAEMITHLSTSNADHILWCNVLNENIVELHDLQSNGRIWFWSQNPITYDVIELITDKRIDGIILVSDIHRMGYRIYKDFNRIHYVYNPISPVFDKQPKRVFPQHPTLVFAGQISEHKGAHRLFQTWAKVRSKVSDARLIIVGSRRLHGDELGVGSLGLAAPDFELKYIQPLIQEFGSLENAGVDLIGLVGPKSLADIYRQATLGCVNFNWQGSLETFCCAAVEMLACELPVISFARGALPETIGRSGGTFLVDVDDLDHMAEEIIRVLYHTPDLSVYGQLGRSFVSSEYRLSKITDAWEALLHSPTQYWHQIQRHGNHGLPLHATYYDIVRWSSRIGLSGLIRNSTRLIKSILIK